MRFYDNPPLKAYLVHHGIKGQKWGIRRFRNEDGSLTSAGKERYLKGFAGSNSDVRIVGKDGAQAVISEELLSQLEEMARKESARDLEELKNTRTIKSLLFCPKMPFKMTASDNVHYTNPDLFTEEGASMNCPFCTTAMALRERGYAVAARSDYTKGMPSEFFEKAFNSKTVRMKNARSGNDLLRELGKNGDGAYGHLGFSWSLGGDHSVFWKNEKGRTRIYDGQIGMEYTESKELFREFANEIDFGDSGITYNRLDNCKPTEYALAAVKRSGV